MFFNILILVVALILVVKAADWFLKSVDVIGQKFHLPAFVLGVVLVGFGTSLPELATSVSSILNDTHNVAIANIVGSNVANVLVILGIMTLLFGSITFKKNLIDLDLPYLLTMTILFGILILDSNLTFLDGLLLSISFIGYLVYNLTQKSDKPNLGLIAWLKKISLKAKDQRSTLNSKVSKPASISHKQLILSLIVLVVSATILAISSRLAIDNMLQIAQEVQIGIEIATFLTIALGTSLPELLVSYKALRQGKGDLVLGNIIGSCAFNILLVGGVAGLLHTQIINTSVLGWSLLGLLASALILLVNGITKEIRLWEGAVFLSIYVALMINIVNL
ncbi:MAG: calcium/sodium antiporter [Candidatus Saccharibacteria bacterium]|nr:calcium/sodium antiporter [Candidatus Saccharibacteria bacterium]MCY4010842.1 calcium/sodium antiporter [Candidatus Saccharibacteria bacterium]MCY4088574.1 calcium/sodium antiporter [Candidatus Saccharibacteria bacterium]